MQIIRAGSTLLFGCTLYHQFQVTFQRPVPKFILIIPSVIDKFQILCGTGNLQNNFTSYLLKYQSSKLKYRSREI